VLSLSLSVAQVTRLLLGDASGARLELEVPREADHDDVRVRGQMAFSADASPSTAPRGGLSRLPCFQAGDEAEVMVVSDDPSLARFRAVREVYLPQLGLWLAEYPFLERRATAALSDAIAAERDSRGA